MTPLIDSWILEEGVGPKVEEKDDEGEAKEEVKDEEEVVIQEEDVQYEGF